MKSISKIARSVAIIMDGNGRWAQQRGLDRIEGHVRGVEAVRRVTKVAAQRGVEYLTIYAFSTENWGRPDSEVNSLMELMGRAIINEVPELKESGVRLRFIGDRLRFTPQMQQIMKSAEEQTAECEKLHLVVALNYSSRDEIRRATVSLVERAQRGEIEAEQITEQMIGASLDTAGMPDPDLVIRTSGEQRLSNFMMWQASYAELYFPEVLWPEFSEADFDKALEIYSSRDRRFGLVTQV